MAATVLSSIPARLDPIGAVASWMLAPLVSVIAVAYAVSRDIAGSAEIRHPEIATAAVLLLVVSGTLLTIAAHPRSGRLGAVGAVLVVVCAIVAAALSSVSTWGHNQYIQDDWGQLGIGLFIFGLLWLRPPREIGVFGVFGAIVVGALAAGQAGTLSIANTPYVYAVVAMTPVLVFAAVAATSGAILSRYSIDWLTSARRSIVDIEPELRMLEQDALHRAQLDELRRVTLPLLASIADRGFVTAGDVAAAATVSARLREHALEQSRITWVEGLIETTGMSSRAVDDPERLLPRMRSRERAALTACLKELAGLGAIDIVAARITVAWAPTVGPSARARFEVSVPLAAQWRLARRTARPFVSVLRGLTGDVSMTRNEAIMTMRLGFEPA